jgi:hypothetical protein
MCSCASLDLKRATSITSIDMGPCRDLRQLALPTSLVTMADECFALTRLCSFDSTGLTSLTRIGSDFLYRSFSLTDVNLSGFSEVSVIENRFLSRCEALEEIDLGPLVSVTSIASHFLSESGALRNVKNVQGLRKVRKIEEGFISRMESLERLDLAAMTSVVFIGADFVSRNPVLRRVDISGFRGSLKTILRGAFSGCPALSRLDTTGLASLQLAPRFGEFVTGINTINLGKLRSLPEIPAHCMSDAVDVHTVKTAGLAAADRPGGPITAAGAYAFYAMPALTSIDLTGFAHVADLCDGFLSACTSLTEFSTEGGRLSQVQTIANGMLSSCNRLVRFDAAGLGATLSIGNHFLSGCASLTDVSFVGLVQLQRVGHGFLGQCRQLEYLDTAGLDSLTSVGNQFAFHCDHLADVDTRGLASLCSALGDFFSACPRLGNFDGGNLTSLTQLGYNAFGSAAPAAGDPDGSSGASIALPKMPDHALRLPC